WSFPRNVAKFVWTVCSSLSYPRSFWYVSYWLFFRPVSFSFSALSRFMYGIFLSSYRSFITFRSVSYQFISVWCSWRNFFLFLLLRNCRYTDLFARYCPV